MLDRRCARGGKMIAVIVNLSVIWVKKLFRLFLFVGLNIFALFFFTFLIVPLISGFVYKLTGITIDKSIINTFIGALIGLNASLYISINKSVNELYKDEIIVEYGKYKKVVDICLFCLTDKDGIKLFRSNYNTIKCVEINGYVFQKRILNLLNIDYFNIKLLNDKIIQIKNTVDEYMKYFFQFSETDFSENENDLFRIIDIFFGSLSEKDKIESIDFYFQKFKERNQTDGKSTNDFYNWLDNNIETNELAKHLEYMTKQMKYRRIILDYNYRLCTKKTRMNLFRDV